jgi:hypothetical protein
MKKAWIIVISLAAALLLTLLLWYYRLGGFNDPVLSEAEEGPFYLAGVYYEGHVKDPSMSALFDSCYAKVERAELPGTLASHFMNDPNASKGMIKAFIGVAFSDSLHPLPKGYQWHVFPKKSGLKASLEAHFMLAPVKIYPALEELAAQKKKKLADESLELYPSDKQVLVLCPYIEE